MFNPRYKRFRAILELGKRGLRENQHRFTLFSISSKFSILPTERNFTLATESLIFHFSRNAHTHAIRNNPIDEILTFRRFTGESETFISFQFDSVSNDGIFYKYELRPFVARCFQTRVSYSWNKINKFSLWKEYWKFSFYFDNFRRVSIIDCVIYLFIVLYITSRCGQKWNCLRFNWCKNIRNICTFVTKLI